MNSRVENGFKAWHKFVTTSDLRVNSNSHPKNNVNDYILKI